MADRISELPDSILCHILSFIPTKDAATTSILSKRWKSVWLSIFTLNFSTKYFKDINSFRRSVYKALFSRNLIFPIHSFRFKCGNSFPPCYDYDVNNFVYFVMQRGIQNLNISAGIKLPPCVLNCNMLRVLKLKRITVNDLPHQVNFPVLKTLYLIMVSFQHHEYLVKLLSGCPILEELYTKHSRVVLPIGSFSQEKKFQQLLPYLIKAVIYDDDVIPITFIPNVDRLRVKLRTWIDCTKPPMFHNLTHMELEIRHIYWSNMLDWLLQMLEHCHKLQSFIIKDRARQEELNEKSWKDPPIVPKCLSSLRTCCLKGYKGKELQLQFAKYILQNSKVLRTMTVKCSRLLDVNAKDQMLMKLSSFTRGSGVCNILLD